MAFISEHWRKYLTTIVLVPDIPLFPKHFSLRSTSSPYLNCIAMNQSQDTEWGVKYLCYRASMKKLHLSWSSNGPIRGQDCINTAMPYERTARLWNNSFLCLPRYRLLKLRWSVPWWWPRNFQGHSKKKKKNKARRLPSVQIKSP